MEQEERGSQKETAAIASDCRDVFYDEPIIRSLSDLLLGVDLGTYFREFLMNVRVVSVEVTQFAKFFQADLSLTLCYESSWCIDHN